MIASEAQVNEAAESRALVPVEAALPRALRAPRRAAPFLAQLIATRAHAPQTRVNRRAEPAEVIACYRAVAGMVKNRAA